MINICIKDIVEATKGKLLCGDEKQQIDHLSIDSRSSQMCIRDRMQLLHTYNFRWFGVMAYFMPLILFLLPCFIISNWHNSGLIQKVTASILLFLSIETILSIVYETSNIFTVGGGLVGHTLFGILYSALDVYKRQLLYRMHVHRSYTAFLVLMPMMQSVESECQTKHRYRIHFESDSCLSSDYCRNPDRYCVSP